MFVYSYQLLFLLTVLNLPAISRSMASAPKKIISVDFEVYGVVQGVFFRKYTQKQASKLDLKGWCMNTEKGTVRGTMQGDLSKINEMKMWLQKIGSPSSRIDKAEFKNEQEIKTVTYNNFAIKR